MPPRDICQVPGCGLPTKGGVSPQQDVCIGHWMMISPPLRATLTFLFHSGKTRDGYPEARANAFQQLLEKVGR